jgi:hypothetical protein
MRKLAAFGAPLLLLLVVVSTILQTRVCHDRDMSPNGESQWTYVDYGLGTDLGASV